jgi:vitamin B12 transporter
VPLSVRFASGVARVRDVFVTALCFGVLLSAWVSVRSAADEIPVDDPTDTSVTDTDSADSNPAGADPVVQSPTAEKPAEGAPAAHQVGDVIATATRSDTPAAQVASSVTVITSEEIERRQLALVTDVLRRVPGVDVRRTGGPGSTTSIFVRGGDSDHVLVLLDGVELNDPSNPSRAPILNDLTTEDIERIEVVRGPQSVLYGGDAMSGVIQIFTKRGSGKPKVVGSGEGGSYSTARGVISISGATDDLNYAVSGSYWSSDGFSSRSSGVERDGYKNGTTSARGGWKLNDQFSVDGMLRYSNAKVEYDASVFAENDHHIDTEQWLARIAPRLSLFEGRWVQTLSGQFSRNERDTKAAPPFSVGLPSFHTQIDGNLYALDWQNELRVIKGHTVTLGLEQQWEEADLASFDFMAFNYNTYSDSRDNFGVYLQDQFTWGERLFGTAGFRYDNSSDFESEFTYRFTLGVSVPEIHTIFRSSYGTGYKAPSLADINVNAFGGNPNLDPEKSKGVDVGFETSLCDDRFVTTGTFFYNDVDDLIIAFDVDPDPMVVDFLNSNIDHSEAYGVEASIDLEVVKNLRLTGNYTYTHTEVQGAPKAFGIVDGSRLLRRPTHKASFDLILGFLDNRGQLAANILYIGDRKDLTPSGPGNPGPETIGDYVTLNLTGRFKVNDWLTVFGRVDNVWDEDYEDVFGFQTAGVSAYGGIRLEY